MWEVLEAAGELCLLWSRPVCLLVAHLIATAVKHSDQPSTLLDVPSREKMDWGILRGDSDAVYILRFPALQCKRFNIGDTCSMA